MQLDARKFDFNEQTRTLVAEASDFGLKQIPQDIVLEHPQGTVAGRFVFERPDVHHGETTGYLYREVRPNNVPRKLLLIND